MRHLVFLAALVFAFAFGCSDSSEAPPMGVPAVLESTTDPGVELTIHRGNGQPEQVHQIPGGLSKEAQDDAIRQAIGMLSKVEEDKVHQTMGAIEAGMQKPIACLYLAVHSTSAFFDSERTAWTGTNYHVGVVPVLQDLGDVVKTLVPTQNPMVYDVVYFTKDRLSSSPENTETFEDTGSYPSDSLVPALCKPGSPEMAAPPAAVPSVTPSTPPSHPAGQNKSGIRLSPKQAGRAG